MNKLCKALVILLLVSAFILAAWPILHNEIMFHVDIARDFLLVEDIVKNKPLTLIGPRSGGIPGVFHGPLWLYLNVPAFIAGQGNPVIIGWFWVILYGIFLFTVFKVSEKMFDKKTAVIATILSAVVSTESISSLFNPFGAVMLSPIFFYLFWSYTRQNRIIFLAAAFFILGLIIQFQMAFGIPILILTIPYLFINLFKKKKLVHIFATLVILIPLSTFILFDIKHNFLESRSVIDYILGKNNTGKLDISSLKLVSDRLTGIFVTGLSDISRYNRWVSYLLSIVVTFAIYKLYRSKRNEKHKQILSLFLYFYIGFWTITLLFKGTIWSYYYWPFLPLILMLFSSFHKLLNKYLFIAICVFIFIFNFQLSIKNIINSQRSFGDNPSSWFFENELAKRIYVNANEDFGYFIFSGDLFGYSERYGLNYNQSFFKSIKAYPYQKKKITYLLVDHTDNPYVDAVWWKKRQVGITKEPIETWWYKTGFRVEKYILDTEEINSPSDQNLYNSLIFR